MHVPYRGIAQFILYLLAGRFGMAFGTNRLWRTRISCRRWPLPPPAVGRRCQNCPPSYDPGCSRVLGQRSRFSVARHPQNVRPREQRKCWRTSVGMGTQRLHKPTVAASRTPVSGSCELTRSARLARSRAAALSLDGCRWSWSRTLHARGSLGVLPSTSLRKWRGREKTWPRDERGAQPAPGGPRLGVVACASLPPSKR
jgi:hypothetical protein